MQNDESKVRLGDRLDEGIVAHKVSVRVKCFTTIVFKELQVAGEVYYEKENQKESGKTHQDFSSQRAGEEINYPLHSKFKGGWIVVKIHPKPQEPKT
jgi:hypothetical protein